MKSTKAQEIKIPASVWDEMDEIVRKRDANELSPEQLRYLKEKFYILRRGERAKYNEMFFPGKSEYGIKRIIYKLREQGEVFNMPNGEVL